MSKHIVVYATEHDRRFDRFEGRLMPLYIRDAAVDELLKQYLEMSGLKNKTEAIRTALTTAISEARTKTPLIQRIESARQIADKLGPVDPGYDHKRDTDDLSGI